MQSCCWTAQAVCWLQVCGFVPSSLSAILQLEHTGMGHSSSAVPEAGWEQWGESWRCSCPSALRISKHSSVGLAASHKLSIQWLLCKHLPEGHKKKYFPHMEFAMPLAHTHSKLEVCLSSPCSKSVARTVWWPQQYQHLWKGSMWCCNTLRTSLHMKRAVRD